MKQTRTKIALLHHAGCGNLGDTAIIDSVIDNIRLRWGDAEIAVFSMNPDDTAERHGVASYPIRRYRWTSGSPIAAQPSEPGRRGFTDWVKETKNPAIRFPRAVFRELAFFIESYRAVRGFDLLIVSGGGQLTERGGPWSFPYALFVWSLIAKRAGVSWVFLNVGAGPLKHRFSRFFALRALLAADYISFRDRQSQELARELGFSGKSAVFPDNVYGFHVAVSSTAAKSNSRTVVGFAPMPYPLCDLLKRPSDVRSIQNDLTGRLSKFASLLSSHSYSLDLFASDIKSDPEAIEDLRRVLQQEHHVFVPEYKPLRSVDELLARMTAMDYIVTCRFHGVVLAHLLNKPVLAIAHHPKVTYLMSALGLSKYCLEMDTAVPDQLMQTFDSLVSDADLIRASMAASLERHRSELATQFNELFPVDPARAAGRLPSVSETFARLRAS